MSIVTPDMSNRECKHLQQVSHQKTGSGLKGCCASCVSTYAAAACPNSAGMVPSTGIVRTLTFGITCGGIRLRVPAVVAYCVTCIHQVSSAVQGSAAASTTQPSSYQHCYKFDPWGEDNLAASSPGSRTGCRRRQCCPPAGTGASPCSAAPAPGQGSDEARQLTAGCAAVRQPGAGLGFLSRTLQPVPTCARSGWRGGCASGVK